MWWKNLFEKTKNIFQDEEDAEVIIWEDGLNEQNVAERFELLKQSYFSIYNRNEEKTLNQHIEINSDLVKGNYALEGHNPEDTESSYFGQISFKVHEGNQVEATWKIGFSDQAQFGAGFMTNEFIALNFSSSPVAEVADGFIIFRMSDTQTLEGLWLESGCFLPGYEICKLKNKL